MLPGFKRRMQWFLDNKPDVPAAHPDDENARARNAAAAFDRGSRTVAEGAALHAGRIGVPVAARDSRTFARAPRNHRSCWKRQGMSHRVDYEPAESSSGLFGGNSNWRGPIWFPVNFLLIESLQKFHHFLGDEFQVEFPTGSGQNEEPVGSCRGAFAADCRGSFCANEDGRRPVFGEAETVPERSSLARSRSVPRIFSRRYRSGRGRKPPDRMDRPGGQIDRAKRRLIWKRSWLQPRRQRR